MIACAPPRVPVGGVEAPLRDIDRCLTLRGTTLEPYSLRQNRPGEIYVHVPGVMQELIAGGVLPGLQSSGLSSHGAEDSAAES